MRFLQSRASGDHVYLTGAGDDPSEPGVAPTARDVIDRLPLEFDHSATIASFPNKLWKPPLYWTPPGGPFDIEYQQTVARRFLDMPLLVCAARGECIVGHGATSKGRSTLSIHRERRLLNSPSSPPIRRRMTWLGAPHAPTVRVEPHGTAESVVSFQLNRECADVDCDVLFHAQDDGDQRGAAHESRDPRECALGYATRDAHDPTRLRVRAAVSARLANATHCTVRGPAMGPRSASMKVQLLG